MSLSKEEEKKIEKFSYTLFNDNISRFFSNEPERLGELREASVFETEHHEYTVPFRYKNVEVEDWSEYSDKGIELAADSGSITIIEDKPIVSVTVVGSGCSGNNFNILEWWGPGESIDKIKLQLVKRQRIDNLQGQHNAWIQTVLTQEPYFKTLEEAEDVFERLQRTVHEMTSGYYMPGSVMCGLYENTACFRFGDTSRAEHTPYKVVIRGGGLDYEDPGKMYSPSKGRYPAEYCFRLIDVVVKKS